MSTPQTIKPTIINKIQPLVSRVKVHRNATTPSKTTFPHDHLFSSHNQAVRNKAIKETERDSVNMTTSQPAM